jgi:hypothetical protein
MGLNIMTRISPAGSRKKETWQNTPSKKSSYNLAILPM